MFDHFRSISQTDWSDLALIAAEGKTRISTFFHVHFAAGLVLFQNAPSQLKNQLASSLMEQPEEKTNAE